MTHIRATACYSVNVDTETARAIIQRVKARMVELGINQVELAAAVSVTSAAVSNWFSRGAIPPAKYQAVAMALGWSVDELLGNVVHAEGTATGHFGAAVVSQVRRAAPTTGHVPLVEWDANLPVESAPYSIECTDPLTPATGAALRVEQDLMFKAGDKKSLPPGCYIVVKLDTNPQLKGGEIVLVRFAGQQRMTLRQVILDGDRRIFKVLNPSYPLSPETDDGIAIIGVVVERIERTRL